MDIIDKVRKLLKLSESSNANEAALAAAKAQQLIDEHNLSAALLAVETEEAEANEPIEDTLRDSKPLDDQKKMQTWRYALAKVLAECNGCRIYGFRGAIELVGHRSDADKVRYLYGYLIHETERLCNRDGDGCGRTWRNNYRLGVVDTIAIMLQREHNRFKDRAREQVASDSTALVKVDKALARIDARKISIDDFVRKHHRLTHHQTPSRADDWARHLGQIAGQSITIGNARAALK